MMTEFGKFELTDEDMVIFRDAVRKFMAEYGLMDWNIDFEWIDDPDNKALAQVQTLPHNRVGLFQLNKVWTESPTRYHVQRTAFHEVCHLLFSPLRTFACADWLADGAKATMIDMELHAIIRRLESIKYGAW